MQSTITMEEYYEELRKQQKQLAARLDATVKTATSRSRGSNLPNNLAAGDGWEAYKERVGL